jgi:hypothetical protein
LDPRGGKGQESALSRDDSIEHRQGIGVEARVDERFP